MGNCAKIWIVIAAVLVLIGSVSFVVGMTMLEWDFRELSTAKYETNTYSIGEDYKNISIATDTADIVFAPAENGISSVVCYEQTQVKHSVAVKDGTLVIEAVDTRKWYDHIGIHIGTPQITVYLCKSEYGLLSVTSSTGDVEIPKDLQFESMEISESTGNVTNGASVTDTVKIKTSTGNIRVDNISAGAMELSVSTGSVTVSGVTCGGDLKIDVSTGKSELTDIRCNNMISNGSTGKISLNNVTAAENLSIKRSTGDISFVNSDAAEIFVETDTGDVGGSLLTAKVFLAQTGTGRIDVPETATGGICRITTDTGDIQISISG